MDMLEIIKYFTPLGVGGIIAGVTLVYARRDYIQHGTEKLELAKNYAERLEHHVNNLRQERQVLMETLKEVSETISSNTEVIRAAKEEIVRHFK